MVRKYYHIILNKIAARSKPPQVASVAETLQYIINHKSSVSRFGDGELWCILGGSIRFQKHNLELQSKLKMVLESSSKGHIVTLPNIFEQKKLDLRTEVNQQFWNKHLLLHRKDWYRYLNKTKKYYNTAMSRFYSPFKEKASTKKYVALLKKIWEDRDVLIIEGEKSRLGVGNDLFANARSIERILCPAENAFSKYKEILKLAQKTDKNKLLLIALGPTATVLAYDLHVLGFWAIDIGHVDIEYEWFQLGVEEPVKIASKYSNEVEGGNQNIEEVDDQNYLQQIKYKVF